MTADVFDTAAIRSRVLAAWAASPARFREDANAEEDLALGGYRDRVVVELAQNAADAAVRAGIPGRLRLTLREGVLVAANSGSALDLAGVQSLSTLRASAKRDHPGGSVGRFGVGFAAVLAITDEPALISRSGGVRWSRADAHALVEEIPSLAEELVRRSGAVPVLRLPFPAEGGPPDGYETAVILPLRDSAADELARRLLAEIDDALLLALPGLAEVVVEIDGSTRALAARREGAEVVVTDDGSATRWRLATAGGEVDAALLADRPTEERLGTAWSVTWAVPLGSGQVPVPLPPATPAVVHAPTPTDEPLGLPALLMATFPLDPTRRHVAHGPLRAFLVERAAETYAGLLTELPPSPAILTLIPGPVGKSELDAEIRRALVAALPETPFLVPVEDPGIRLRPRDALVLERADEALVEVLAPALPNLLPAGWDRHRTALNVAGVRRISLAELVDALAGVEREPSWWNRLYGALDQALNGGADIDRDALAALPVPLADGRRMRGPRGVLLTSGDLDPEPLHALGLRVAHPDAAHPLLERFGAVRANPRSVLADPTLRAAVMASFEAEDPGYLADAVLRLAAAARLAPGDEPWLAELALPDADGELAPAGELMLPGSPITEVVAPGLLGVVSAELVDRWGADALEAVGVLRTFSLVRDTDVVLDSETCDHDLHDEDSWLADTLAGLPGSDVPPLLPELVAVRDLDLVAADAWPRALRMLAEPPLRRALVVPARVLLPGGQVAGVIPYAAWWLRRHAVLDGRAPVGLRAAGADPLLRGLYDEAAADLDPEFLQGLGVRTTLTALLAELDGPQELLDRLADPERPVSRGQLRQLMLALASVDPDRVRPPERLRATVAGRPEVVDAASIVVVDAPALLPLLGDRPCLVVPPDVAAGLADLLALPLGSEVVAGVLGDPGIPRPVPEQVRELLPEAPPEYAEHDRLLVDDVEVEWWCAAGVVHAATVEGLARGLTWAAGRWERRFEAAALLVEPQRAEELWAEREFDAEP